MVMKKVPHELRMSVVAYLTLIFLHCLLVAYTTVTVKTVLPSTNMAFVTDEGRNNVSTDWSLCVFCQKQKHMREPLVDPFLSNGTGYASVERDLTALRSIHMLKDLDISRLDEGHGIQYTLAQNRGKWHKRCRGRYTSTVVSRATKKRQSTTLSSLEENVDMPEKKKFRPEKQESTEHKVTCIFGCGKKGKLEKGSNAMAIRLIALADQENDSQLVHQLQSQQTSDTFSQFSYHLSCYRALQRKANKVVPDNTSHTVLSDSVKASQDMVFKDTINHIDSYLNTAEVPVMKFSDVFSFFKKRADEEKISIEGYHNATRFKDEVCMRMQGLNAETVGRELLLYRNCDISTLLSSAVQKESRSDIHYLKQTAEILRRDLFSESFTFKRTFTKHCHEAATPALLQCFISLLLEGKESFETKPICHAICQVIKYNSKKGHSRAKNQSTQRHSATQETPLPLYLGLLVHLETRSRKLIEKLHDLGLSVSYQRVLQLQAEVESTVCDFYTREDVVVPTNAKQGLFTTTQIDNLDHNPSSNTAKGSFHGTTISVAQHPDTENEGRPVFTSVIPGNNCRSAGRKDETQEQKSLPTHYSQVATCPEPPKKVPIPEMSCTMSTEQTSDQSFLAEETLWQRYVKTALEENSTEIKCWSAYHSERCITSVQKGSIGLLPLFEEKAETTSMIKHSFEISARATRYLNNDQIPVLVLDQPLFKLAKKIQWAWPEQYGEKKFVIILGGFHIEKALWATLGTWLSSSGWTALLVQAGLCGSGRAQGYLTAAHVKRTRHVHEVTAAVLNMLKEESYRQALEYDSSVSKDEWLEQTSGEPMFVYWDIVLHIQRLIFSFVRALRTSDFVLYVTSLKAVIPWFFVTNHHNYARWASVHLRDMTTLSSEHPEVYSEFEKGHFSFNKSVRRFSSIALDQAHEQENKMVKDEGGAKGLTEDPAALRKWVIAGPEFSRITTEFEESFRGPDSTRNKQSDLHHEESSSYNKTFRKDITALKKVIEDAGNPFLEKSGTLHSLATNVVADDKKVSQLSHVADIGKEQFDNFVRERFEEKTKSVFDPLKQNSLNMFEDKKRPKGKHEPKSADTSHLFAQMYITCQTRGHNLDEFFQFENGPYPPSISDDGDLKGGVKAQLIECLESLSETYSLVSVEPRAESTVLDGAWLVHSLRPGQAKTFDEFFQSVFLPKILMYLSKTKRLDIVFDEYLKLSVKNNCRRKRGTSREVKVEGNTLMPSDWQEFLKNASNKAQLFSFLASRIKLVTTDDDKVLVVTNGQTVTTSKPLPSDVTAMLQPCSHEEADTRVFLHCLSASASGHKDILLYASDTDIVVLAVHFFTKLNINTLWVGFGSGKSFRFIPVHAVSEALGEDRCLALPMLHAMSGCDTVSFFAYKGKKSFFSLWQSNSEFVKVTKQLMQRPNRLGTLMPLVEKVVAQVYEPGTEFTKVNPQRKHLYTKQNRPFHKIPPTRSALLQHMKRAVYQAAFVWGKATVTNPKLPDPTKWGWELVSGDYVPVWSSQPQASKACSKLIRCRCKVRCTGRCKCKDKKLSCTGLCSCDGNCYGKKR